MRYMEMTPAQLRAEYWTERNGLASVGNLACAVTTPKGRRTAARLTGSKLGRFDLICNVARKRGIDLLATDDAPEAQTAEHHPATATLRESWSVVNPHGTAIHYGSKAEAEEAAATGIF